MAEPIKYESALPQLLTTLLGTKSGASGTTTSTNSGSTQTETNTADTEALRTVFGQQNAMNTPEGMKAALMELFTKGAMEVPGLTQAYANASGTRTTANSGLQLALGELNKQLAGKAGELLQANMANSAQTGNAIANATKSSVVTKGPSTTTGATSENKATGANVKSSDALLATLLGSAANMADKKGLFGKLGAKLGFSDGAADFSNNFSSSGGVLDQNSLGAGYDSYDFQNVPGAGAADIAGLGSAGASFGDLASGLDFGSIGAEAAGSLGFDVAGNFGSDFGDLADFGTDFASDGVTTGLGEAAGDFIDFGEFFADGGLVDTASIRGAHKASISEKLTKQLPSGGRAPGYADGGLVTKGNIDLNNRPRVKNKDGSISTVRSMGVNIDGKEVLIPTVSDDGRIMSDDESVQQYRNTGKHLGIFDSVDSSNRYAEQLHNDQAKQYVKPRYADGGTVDTSVVRNRNNMGTPTPRQGSAAINLDPSQLTLRASPASVPAAQLQNILRARSKAAEESDASADSGGGGQAGGNPGATAVDAQGGFNALVGSLAGSMFGLVGSLGAKAMGATGLQGQAISAAAQALGLSGGGGDVAGFGGSDVSGFAGSNSSGSGLGFDGSGNTLGDGPSGLDGSTGESESGGALGGFGDAGSGASGDSGSDSGGMGGMGGSGEGGGGFGGAADGGSINGPGTGTSDSIHARLSDGEFVMSADVVNHLGSDFFQKLQDTFHVPAAQQRMSR